MLERQPPRARFGSRASRIAGGGWRWLVRSRKRRLLGIATTILAVSAVWLRCGPPPPGLLDFQSESTVVSDRHGAPLYEALSGDGTRSVQLTAEIGRASCRERV